MRTRCNTFKSHHEPAPERGRLTGADQGSMWLACYRWGQAPTRRVELSLIAGPDIASSCHNALLYDREETIGVDVEKLSFER